MRGEKSTDEKTDQQKSLTAPSRKDIRSKRLRRRRRRLMTTGLSIVAAIVVIIFGGIGVAFGTPWGSNLRLLTAETIVSTRHYTWAQYITTHTEYVKLLKGLDAISVTSSNVNDVKVQPAHSSTSGPSSQDVSMSSGASSQSPIQVIPLKENGYTGDVILVKDPKLVRLVPAQVHGSMGEYITSMAKRVGAIAGINASGFEDPHGDGWGGIPVGLEYVNGQVKQASKRDPSWATVGFTQSGVMVMGNYSTADLAKLGVRDAMQFHPELVVNGQPTITQGDGGWGVDPRTAIGQAKDGTVILVVINGRLHGDSVGATMKQVMDIMLRYHAVNACAMDGGSSSVMYDDGNIINSPSTIDPNGQRHLPDAWMVFPTENAANSLGN